MKINTKKIKNDEEIRNYIIRELKLISIVNNTKVNNLLDPNDPEGESYRFFQSYIKGLKERGVILAVCSKNDDFLEKRAELRKI